MDQQGRLDNPWSIYNILDSWFGERLNADTISRINGMPTGHWESLWEYANSNPPFSPITLLAPGELRPYVPAMTKHDYKKEGEQRQVSFSSNRQLSARFVRSIKTCALYSHSISVSGRLDWLGPPDRPNLRSDAVTAQQISVASAQAKEVWRQSARKALGALLEIRSLVEAGIVVLDTEWRDRDDLIDRELLASLPKNFIAIPEGSSTSGADDGYDGIRIPDLRMIFDLHMVAARLDGATAGRAHLLFETRELESAFRELLRLGILRSGAGVGADLGHQPGGRLFSLLHQFEIPDLSGLSCADLARARATEGAFETWRADLTSALATVEQLVDDDSWCEQARHILAECMAGHGERLRSRIASTRTLSQVQAAIKTLCFSGVGTAVAGTLGSPIIPALAGGAVTAVLAGAARYVQTRQERRKGRALLDFYMTIEGDMR